MLNTPFNLAYLLMAHDGRSHRAVAFIAGICNLDQFGMSSLKQFGVPGQSDESVEVS